MASHVPQALVDHVRAAGSASIPAHGVDVWHFSLDRSAGFRDAVGASLSSGERARADRFRHARHRWRYVVAHGIVRLVLSAYTGSPPSEIQFHIDARGKPHLRPSADGTAWAFNLSHSGHIGAMAVGRVDDLGVDVEDATTPVEPRWLRTVLSDAERAYLDSLRPSAVNAELRRMWVRKEAYVKAIGVGLGRPLRFVDVTHHVLDGGVIVEDAFVPSGPATYRIDSFGDGHAFVGAVAHGCPCPHRPHGDLVRTFGVPESSQDSPAAS